MHVHVYVHVHVRVRIHIRQSLPHTRHVRVHVRRTDRYTDLSGDPTPADTPAQLMVLRSGGRDVHGEKPTNLCGSPPRGGVHVRRRPHASMFAPPNGLSSTRGGSAQPRHRQVARMPASRATRQATACKHTFCMHHRRPCAALRISPLTRRLPHGTSRESSEATPGAAETRRWALHDVLLAAVGQIEIHPDHVGVVW